MYIHTESINIAGQDDKEVSTLLVKTSRSLGKGMFYILKAAIWHGKGGKDGGFLAHDRSAMVMFGDFGHWECFGDDGTEWLKPTPPLLDK